MRIDDNNILKVILIGSITLALTFTLLGFIFFTSREGFGVLAGAAITILNFAWQRSVLQRLLGLEIGNPTRYSTVRYLLRLVITAVTLYYIIISGYFSIYGLLAGLSVVMATIVISSICFAIQNKGD